MDKLFVNKGQPLKMHVESDDPVEVVKMTKLILDNGGFVLPAPDDETIVLAEESVCQEIQHPKYHTSWLHDCTEERKMLKIGGYLLMPHEWPREVPIPRDDPQRKSKTVPGRTPSLSPAMFSSTFRPHSATLEMGNSDATGSYHFSPTAAFSDSGKSVVDDNTRVFAESLSYLPETFPQEAKELRDTGGDASKIVEAPVESSSPSLEKHFMVPSDNPDPGRPKRGRRRKYNLRASRSVEGSRGRASGGAKSAKPSVEPVIEPKVKRRKTSPEGSSSETSASSHSHKRYSEEEHQKMINFLIENDAISTSLRESVWKKAEATGIFSDPHRSTASLVTHFRDNVRYNFEKYVSDPKAVKDFEKYFTEVSTRKLHGKSYSDAEERKIVQYLIKNNSIGQAFGLKIWEQMEADKILVKPHRSARGLQRHFCNNLQYNYMNYTDNAEALMEFENLRNAKNKSSDVHSPRAKVPRKKV